MYDVLIANSFAEDGFKRTSLFSAEAERNGSKDTDLYGSRLTRIAMT